MYWFHVSFLFIPQSNYVWLLFWCLYFFWYFHHRFLFQEYIFIRLMFMQSSRISLFSRWLFSLISYLFMYTNNFHMVFLFYDFSAIIAIKIWHLTFLLTFFTAALVYIVNVEPSLYFSHGITQPSSLATFVSLSSGSLFEISKNKYFQPFQCCSVFHVIFYINILKSCFCNWAKIDLLCIFSSSCPSK